MNTVGYFEIQSSDPAREKKFYETIFGWKMTRQEEIPIEYYLIQTASITGGLLKRPVPVPAGPAGTNAYVCSIQVENFDKTSELILKNGGQVAMAKFPITGRCWQGYFLDADKNTFGIFEADVNAG
jgi:predicted enzyme related to lactoylglutathione lyase